MIALNNLRKSRTYRCVNFGEIREFQVMDILIDDFELKDIHTFEIYFYSEIVMYGKGNDFDIDEIN